MISDIYFGNVSADGIFSENGEGVFLSAIVDRMMPPLNSSVMPEAGQVYELDLTPYGLDGVDSSIELEIRRVIIRSQKGDLNLLVDILEEDLLTFQAFVDRVAVMRSAIDVTGELQQSDLPQELQDLESAFEDYEEPEEEVIDVTPATRETRPYRGSSRSVMANSTLPPDATGDDFDPFTDAEVAKSRVNQLFGLPSDAQTTPEIRTVRQTPTPGTRTDAAQGKDSKKKKKLNPQKARSRNKSATRRGI